MNSNSQILMAMRIGCLAVYVLGLAGALGQLPATWAGPAQWFAVFVLASHTLELFIFWKHLRLHRGTAAASVVLAILFGSLHWFPLLRAKRAARGTRIGRNPIRSPD